MPLWVWNGEVTESYIESTLTAFKANGIGGVFIHARPGLITEYLSERWFECWGHALQTCQALGLECHLYDEFSFPSGFAGGHVVANDPDSAIRSIEPDGQGGVRWGHGKVDGWTAYTPLTSLTRRQTTQTFIQTTHQRYADRFGAAAGAEWKYCFTDEPTLDCTGGFYASPDFLAAFNVEHGYDFCEHVDTYLDADPARSWRVRFDYWQTANRLFTTHYCTPLHDWCATNRVHFTGHFDEHTWPSPLSVPDCMAAQRWMQTPGIDLLGFQYNTDTLVENALYHMTLREVVSIARQLQRSRILCECYGGGGYGYTLDQAKSMSVALLGHGVNLLSPHISMQSILGSRKYDWGQTLSPHAPWWTFYHGLADHDARASFLLSHSTPCARILVVQPTLTGWLHAIPKQFRDRMGAESEHTATETLRTQHARFLDDLARNGMEFELGDEYVMAELGHIDQKRLQIGAAAYDAVILPPGMETMLESTLHLLQSFEQAGGRVFAHVSPARTVHGRPDDRPTAWIKDSGCVSFHSATELTEILDSIAPARLRTDMDWIMHERRTEEGTALFVLANPGPESISGTVNIDSPLNLEAWDPNTGKITPVVVEQTDHGHLAHLHLPARSLVFWIETSTPTASPVSSPATYIQLPLAESNVTRLEPNVCVLPLCNLQAGQDSLRQVTTAKANRRIWQLHGFPQDPWEWTIQHKREYVDRHFEADTGFVAEYPFTIEPHSLDRISATMELAVERPWLYRIAINNIPIDTATGSPWMDPDIHSIAIGTCIRPGSNTIQLRCSPMTIHAELAPVFLRGDFAVCDSEVGLRLTQAQPLHLGSWLRQGLPFYADAVRYEWGCVLAAAASGLRIQLPEWYGSAARLLIDHQPIGECIARPWTVEIERTFVAGPHSLAIDVFGNTDSLLGPFFRKGLPIPWTWTDGPANIPRLADYVGLSEKGLFAEPQVEWRHS